MRECVKCKYLNPAKAKFCMECGTRLQDAEYQFVLDTDQVQILQENQQLKREAERRQLTILFCDLVGSTSLSEKLDPEDYRQVILGYQQVAEKVILRYGGYIAQYLGDGLLVYFGYPKGLEDAPRSGVQTGLGILKAVEYANQKWEEAGKTTIQVRIGIHTGLVVVDDHLALGDTTNIAARIEGLAPLNSLAISSHTYKLVKGWFEVESMGEQVLKGISKPMEVFKVLHESGARSRLDLAKDRGLSPLVGRRRELELLTEKWKRAEMGKGNLVLLNGEAGIGKSRLLYTIEAHIAEKSNIWLAEIRCSSYHQTSAFYPIIEFLEKGVLQYSPEEQTESKIRKLEGFLLQADMDLERDLPLFADFLSIPPIVYTAPNISPMAKKMRIMERLNQALLNLANRKAVLMVVEDLHWADASTLEWLNIFVQQLPSNSIFCICTTRPGFHAAWVDQEQTSQLFLDRLAPEDIVKICHHQTKGKTLPKEILEQINKKTDGVPLFVEELSKMILESDLLNESDTHFEIKGIIPPLAIPSTLQDSLLARLDKLPSAKEVVQLGAVLGREFSVELLQAVLSPNQENIEASLSQLVDAELLFPIYGDNKIVYQFKHALIQDTAYESMLKSRRKRLHQQVAEVLENQFGQINHTQPEVIAHHYTEAGLMLQAIPLWLRAGQMASQKHANSEAISHLENGLNLLEHIENKEERKNLELDFVLSLGGSVIVYYGYTHPKVGETFNRALDIAKVVEVSPKLALILYNLQTFYMLSEKQNISDELVQYELQLGREEDNAYLFQLIGHASLGVSSVIYGNFEVANDNLMKAVELYNPEIIIPYEFTPGGDVKINAASWQSLSLQVSGYGDQAKSISEKHIRLAKDFKDSRTLYHIYGWAAWRALIAKEWEIAVDIMQKYLPMAREFGDPFFVLVAESYYNVGLAFQGSKSALDNLVSLAKTAIKLGATTFYSIGFPYICAAYYRFGEYRNALDTIDEALTHLDKTGSHFNTAELYRIKGISLQGLGETDALVERSLKKSLALARKQSAKIFELRAAVDLAKLWSKQGKVEKSYRLLREVYDWFSEGYESIDLKEARRVLEKLSADQIVK